MRGRGTVLGGRYRLVERIGGGAMGEVWRAADEVLERDVAVKILLPALLEDAMFAARFRREAKILAALSHPGIVDVHDYGEGEGQDEGAYIVMELIDGQSLERVRADSGPLPVAEAIDIVAQALDALHAAHRRGIVHRDIKPSNLMLRPDGRVAVTDFGIARAAARTKLTAPDAVLGTAHYIAPEQAEGIATVPASDLYSLGVVCYELLTGELPFTGDSVLEIVLKHIREPAPELPAGFPDAVRAFVSRALAKQPEDRYPDAAVMAAAARRALAGQAEPAPVPAPVPVPVPDPAPAPAAKAEPHTRRGRTIALFVPGVLVVVVSTTLYIDRGAAQPDAAHTPGPGPVVSIGAPGGPGAGTSPSVGPSASASPGAVPSPGGAAGGADQAPGTGTGPGPTQGNAGGSGATPSANGSGGPGSSGNKPSGPPATKAPAVPQGCGGDNWGAITSVGDGLKIGLAASSPEGGTKVIMGGHTEFGWVHTTPQWTKFNSCSMSGPRLGKGYQSSTPQLIPQYGAADTSWKLLTAPTAGAYYIKDYSGKKCLTNTGAGRELTVTACTPGNKTQQWYVP
ncbi:serine/threonine-protein kinase [Streptomyces sp. NPDC002054]|uniref:serine/threonine-protein kinase n=1 Tax=Streptomyces sp. NPDC002054 TaxID=3154663 RepID=UPI0033262621